MILLCLFILPLHTHIHDDRNVEHFTSDGPHGHMMFSLTSIREIGSKIRERCRLPPLNI